MKRPIAIHPFLFAISPILLLFSHNVTQVLLDEIIRPVIIVICFTLLLWLLLTLIVRNSNKAGIIVSTFLILFFSYGHFFDVTRGLAVTGLILWGTLFAWVVSCTIMTRSNLHNPTIILNIVAAFLVAIPTGSAVYSIASAPRVSMEIPINTTNLKKPDKCPDIYYIILDGYARADVLKDFYEYDNSEFLEYLAQKSFYVAANSRANYCQTNLSLASSLNLKYLDDLANQVGTETVNRKPLIRMIQNSYISAFLRQYGYVFVAFSSGYSGTEIRNADVYLTLPKWLTEFENVLINTTPIPVLQHRPQSESRRGDTLLAPGQYDLHRDRLLYIFDHLADMTAMDSPVFVFAHIIAPHPPFVFGEYGEPVEPNRKFSFVDGSHFMAVGDREEYITNYSRQLTYVNQKITQTIDEIISNCREAPIIILQADHGPGSMLDWSNPDKTDFRERMTILNAYYLPDGGQEELYSGITPVNTFRIILNHYFGTDYELLADESYFSIWDEPYKFINVTAELGTD